MKIFIFHTAGYYDSATIAVIAKTKENALSLIEKDYLGLFYNLELVCEYEVINSYNKEEITYYSYCSK